MESEELHPDRNIPRCPARDGSRHSRTKNSSRRYRTVGRFCRVDREPRVAIHAEFRKNGLRLDSGKIRRFVEYIRIKYILYIGVGVGVINS